MTFSEQPHCEVIERNVRMDHVHLVVMIPPKTSVSDYVGAVKGTSRSLISGRPQAERAAASGPLIRVLNKFRRLKEKPYWGNHFWSRGYCADTVGLDSEMIRKYVKYQEAKERKEEETQRKLF